MTGFVVLNFSKAMFCHLKDNNLINFAVQFQKNVRSYSNYSG